MKLEPSLRQTLLASLAGMPEWLQDRFGMLNAEQAQTRGRDGAFSPVEQVWHLADLENEGFGRRIARLQTEQAPLLPDFDGTAVAASRHYRSLSLADGLQAFRRARERNLATLRAVAEADWGRSGSQEGVGPVALCDMPSFMAQHDAAHRAEIEDWKRASGLE